MVAKVDQADRGKTRMWLMNFVNNTVLYVYQK